MTDERPAVLEFTDRRSASSHADFETWRRDHPRGFVVNVRAGEKGMLHFADCNHMEFEAESGVSLTRNPKLASTDAIALLLDPATRSLSLTTCSSCRPQAVGQV